jgi:hypothetical protein
MIPRAVQQVFKDTEELKKQGWTYTMEGQFLEIVSFWLWNIVFLIRILTIL